jgi:Raf kinase inhibitor-like YbhB/YbcL family protein
MADQPRPPLPYDFLPPVPSFTLTSDDIADGETLGTAHHYHDMGMDGGNLSPHLRWEGFPAETRSFAVTCYDPDAPTGSGFWHWLLIDVPATVTTLARGAGAREGGGIPARSFHVRNDYGEQAYGGPPPPQGDRPHTYIFAVHALDVEKLGIDASASPAIAGFNLTFRTLARGLLVPVYGF